MRPGRGTVSWDRGGAGAGTGKGNGSWAEDWGDPRSSWGDGEDSHSSGGTPGPSSLRWKSLPLPRPWLRPVPDLLVRGGPPSTSLGQRVLTLPRWGRGGNSPSRRLSFLTTGAGENRGSPMVGWDVQSLARLGG